MEQHTADLVLASASEARAALLRAAGVSIELHSSDVDEHIVKERMISLGHGAATVALRLAEEKALGVSQRYAQGLVLGADQTLELGARLFSKPKDRTAAAGTLRALSGRCHTLHAAFAFARRGRLVACGVERATLRMRALSDEDIAIYLDAAGPAVFSSVGAYQVEGLGRALFDHIAGDHSTILGLPLTPVVGFLRTWTRREGSIRC